MLEDAPTIPETTLPETPKRNRKRRPLFLVATIGLLFLLVVVPIVWFWRQAHARTTVISKTDPVTGYHVTYTISKGWKKSKPSDAPQLKKGLVDSLEFRPPVPSGLQVWIDKHLFHRASPINVQYGGGMNSIVEYAYQGAQFPATFEDSDGYVWFQPLPGEQLHIVSKERLSISGEPTTWLVGDETVAGMQQKIYGWILIVKHRHTSTYFIFVGTAEGETHYQAIQQEMLAIRDSIRIEK